MIFEDVDGDGKHDKRTVFMEGLNLVSGIEIGFGGVYIGAAPYLLFIPDKDGDDKPDGEPQILLDGWGYEDTHETLNSFIWGPDGWLYGCHGVFTHSKVGKPGTPDEKRVPINAGVWRYHPVKHTFEVFAEGTSNPWGLDYNDVGDFFVEACVIPHLFHIVQGGRYHRQAGVHFNPYTYADIPTIADHRHYTGPTPHAGNNKSDNMGGGHAHCGLMCYLGGTWPKEYRGQLFMGNIHGRRLNVDIPKPKGSGYTASHGKDFLLANDAWARFINLRYGPDGNVYLIDWYDKQACHRYEPEIWDRTNGRIYKIVYKGAKPVTGVNLQKCTDEELVKYQLHENDWYVRHARRVLQERAVSSEPKASAAVLKSLIEIARNHPDETRRLRGLWALHAMGKAPWVVTILDQSPVIKSWSIQLAAENDPSWRRKIGGNHPVAGHEPAIVRRSLASALQRMPLADRWDYLPLLMQFRGDENDPLLLHLCWYAAEPLAEVDPRRALKLAADIHDALLPFMARRVGALGTSDAFSTLVESLDSATKDSNQVAYLAGLQEALKGQRTANMPKGWPDAFAKLSKSPSSEIRSLALAVGVAFRDPAAASALLEIVTDAKADVPARQQALTALLDVGHNRLGGLVKTLVKEPAMRQAAIRGMARLGDDGIPETLLAEYANLTPAEKRDAVNALASRAKFGNALLDAIAEKKIPAADVPAETIRQLRALGSQEIDTKIAAVWGTVRDTPAERKKLISEWSKRLSAKTKNQPDLAHGRAVYAKVCQQCHTLYGVGGKVGPDITGSNRTDLNYLLENMFDPSAVIQKEYAATKLDLTDGRTLIGIVKEETKQALTLLTQTETLTIPVADIDRRTPSELSMMPDDLTKQANDADIRALVAYLRHNQQVPILATQETAKEFFNGKDLTGWDGDKRVWSVENGEIVGKSAIGENVNRFLISTMEVTDFKLTVKVKLVPNTENSGIQFRSVPIEGGEMRGPQADIGKGWWGKLYEESARGLLWKQDHEKLVKENDWNEYVIEAVGSKVRTWLNGQPCVDLDDDKIARRGMIAFQVHSGGPMEVRFKDIKLEVLGGK